MSRTGIVVLVVAALIATSAGAQETQETKSDSAGRLGSLWTRFQEADDDRLRGIVAVDAVRLAREEGISDERVRAMEELLLELARRVVELRMPYPFPFDESGRTETTPGGDLEDGVSDDFRAWASSARMDVGVAAYEAMYLQAIALYGLAPFGTDPRALAILREALTLDNHFAMAAAAIQLASLGDVASLDTIIARADSAPAEVAESLAMMVLLEYQHPKAQAKAKEILGEEEYEELRRARQAKK